MDGDAFLLTFFNENKEINCKCLGIIDGDKFHIVKGSIPVIWKNPNIDYELSMVGPSHIEDALKFIDI